MLGDKIDNTIGDGSNNVQAGGDIVGYTPAQHEAALSERLHEQKELLERAHGAEKLLLQREIQETLNRLENVERDFTERLRELGETRRQLKRYENSVDKEKMDAAKSALGRGDDTLAEALFKECLEIASLRQEDAAREVADLEFELGRIAERKIRWHDAYDHYKRAAQLNPTFETLQKACEFARRSGNFSSANRHGEDLRQLHNDGSLTEEQSASAMNEHAQTLEAQGQYTDAEDLYRQALAIAEKTIGTDHPTYATHLNNLAGVLRAQGQYLEAEGLFRKVLAIDEKTIGTDHSDYAVSLNNLAGTLLAQGQHEEAKTLLLQVLMIDEKTIGEEHPTYAVHVNNLAGVLQAQGQYADAAALFRRALEIDKNTIGTEHPDYASHSTNLADCLKMQGQHTEAEDLYRHALAICETSLGTDHSFTVLVRNNLNDLLKKSSP